jgi:hypothetical protein
MTNEPSAFQSPRMEAAMEEINYLIQQRFPEATFDAGPGEDPMGMHLVATVDLEDLGDVEDLHIGRLVDMQVDELLPLYVIPTRPIERSPRMMRREREKSPWIRGA